MSLSKGLNADESKMLRSLLQRAHENGSLNVFLPTLGSETSEWSEVESLEEDVSAAMNDASKRCLVSPDRQDAKHGQTKQLSSKAVSAVGSKSPTEESSVKIDFAKMKMPSDVQSIEDWGTTIMSEGKMAPRQMSYAELASSSEADIQRYLRWLMSNVNSKNLPQYQDLSHYLHVTKYGEASGPTGFNRVRKTG